MEQFDICISSTIQDRAIAELLAQKLKAYRLPRGVRIPQGRDYRRILLDTDEKPFDDDVRAMLNSSRVLLMICTPRTPKSEAMCRRMEYFKRTYVGENIIGVLAEGEPQDSFPPHFVEVKTVRRILPDMTVVEREETVEPVAADLRSDTPRQARQRLQYEVVRIVASMLELHPDELVNRQERRRRNRMYRTAAAVSAVLLAASGVFGYYGLSAKRAGDIYARQTALGQQTASRLLEELPAAFADIPAAQEEIGQVVDEVSQVLERLTREGR